MKDLIDFVKALRFLSFVFFVAGMYIGVVNYKYATTEPLNINTMTASDIKEKTIVEGDVYYNYGSYEEEFETSMGEKSSDSNWSYVITVGDEENYMYMGLVVSEKDFKKKFDKQTEETYAYLDNSSNKIPESIHIKGRIMKMDDGDEEYFRKFFLGVNPSEEEKENYEKMTVPYRIEYQTEEDYVVPFIVAAGCLLLTILLSVGISKLIRKV